MKSGRFLVGVMAHLLLQLKMLFIIGAGTDTYCQFKKIIGS